MEKLKEDILTMIEKAGGTWGIVIEDLDRNLRWGINEHVQFPAESVIKIPIMAAVFSAVEKQQISLSEEIVLKRENLVGGSGILQHLTPGIRLPVFDLLTLMIVQSDNTATNMLIDLAGIKHIQQTLRDIGMEESSFQRKLIIYPADTNKRNVITASDISVLLNALATGKIVSRHSCQQMINIMKKQQIRNGLPAYLPDPDPEMIGGMPKWELANKTGWSGDRQHDVGILYAGDRTVTITALSQGVNSAIALDTLAKIGKGIYLNIGSDCG
ncbi:serine hydrolase [Scopulibacillus cellulosilyticus]|uniref:Serine hydrolase n=1 Tax=Scopulibacillus cellulosilyticus TaxID=2665665 RepID=A0ABW2Q5F6_9BACL